MNVTPGHERLDYHSPEHWDRVVDSSRNGCFSHGEALVRTMLDAADPLSGARLLDVATGEGRLAIEASARGAHAVGIDISPAALGRAEELSAKQLSAQDPLCHAPTFLNLDARGICFPSATFNVVTVLRAIWVLSDLPSCLLQLNRVLVPGGQLLIQLWGAPRDCRMLGLGASILGRRIPALRLPKDETGPFDTTPESLEPALAAAGFLLESTAWHTIDVRSASPDLYWKKFGTVAGTAHAALLEQPPAVRAEIDAELLARSRAFVDPAGAIVLPLTWAVCSARKQVSAAPASS